MPTETRQRKFYPSQTTVLSRFIKSMDGLLAYYPLDEISGTTAYDKTPAASGSFNGTITGATIGVDGRVGKAYSFDGTDDLINCNSTSLIPDGSSDCSIFAFIKSDVTGEIQSIIGNIRDGTTLGFIFKLSSNHRPEFGFYANTGTLRSWGDVTVDEVPDGEWTFVAVTFYGGRQCEFYVNKKKFFRETLGTAVTMKENTAQNVRIGHRQQAGSGYEFFKGNMQHVTLLNRRITSDEVNRIVSIANL